MPSLFLTSLTPDTGAAQKLAAACQPYGLKSIGHLWVDNLEAFAWAPVRDKLLDKDFSAWIVLGSASELAKESVRWGLSLVSLSVGARRSAGIPAIPVNSNPTVSMEPLPVFLKSTAVIPINHPSLGVKIVAAVNTAVEPEAREYYLDVHAAQGLGLWFEVGPAVEQAWDGAMFGVDLGEIEAHTVGPRGSLPEKAVLEYPVRGLKMNLGTDEITAWAVRNRLDENQSYFVRVAGQPRRLLFCPYDPESNDLEVTVIHLT